jgi:hypothetical protein
LNLIVQSFFAFIKYTKPQDGDSISDIEDDDEIDYQTKSRFDDLETIEEETEEATISRYWCQTIYYLEKEEKNN